MESGQPLEILQRLFGYSQFRHNQQAIIDAVIAGQDALALMPTGGGKSLCYQIPSLIRPGVGVVISPLIALMQDQVDALEQLGIRAAFLNSTLSASQCRAIEQQLINGELDLLYLAPERLLMSSTLKLLDNLEIALFAIDEAHCVSQWGHDFRRDYQQLYLLHERYSRVPRIALTATADKRTRSEIVQQLGLQDAEIFINSFDRPNIRYTISESQNTKENLWQFINDEHPEDAGIVYCLSRKKVEAIAEWLQTKGRTALPYHAGLSDEMRQLHQQRFLREEGVIIVATIAFGMGIDKPDVRFVAHLNLPKSIEAYYQETGRAGRDGAAANAWMAYGLQDVITLRQMTQSSDTETKYKQVVHHKLESMLGLCEHIACRRQVILRYFDEQLDEPCGNCDNCLQPPETWNATEAAQKALSCAYRTGQRFGVNYLVDILLGKEDERIQQNGHDQISTFGIGTDLDVNEWRGLYRQLISLGYLEVDVDCYGALHLTEASRALLRGEMTLQLRKLVKKSRRSGKKSREKSPVRAVDQPLYDALRQLRKSLSEKQDVPPYVIFHDTTLAAMSCIRPASKKDLLSITGVGEQKLVLYGDAVLEVIQQFPLEPLLDNNLNVTVNETLRCYLNGMTAEEIASYRDLKISTVYTHFSEAIGCGLIEAKEILQLDAKDYHAIDNAFNLLSDDDTGVLKPVYESLDGAYDYGVLRCIQAERTWLHA